MKEFREAVFDLLQADAELQTITGYTVADERIYLEYPPERVALDATYPVYLTYKMSQPGMIAMSEFTDGVQEPEVVVEIDVWALTAISRDDAAERITELFRQRHWDLTSWRGLTTDKEAGEDITELQEGTGQVDSHRHYLRFRIRPVYKKD